MNIATLSPISALSSDSWRLWIHLQSTQRFTSIWSKTARRSRLIGSFCKHIARLRSRETGKTTRIPSSALIKQGALKQPAAQYFYHPDHHTTRQRASETQDTLHSPRCSIPVSLSGCLRQAKSIVIYDSL